MVQTHLSHGQVTNSFRQILVNTNAAEEIPASPTLGFMYEVSCFSMIFVSTSSAHTDLDPSSWSREVSYPRR